MGRGRRKRLHLRTSHNNQKGKAMSHKFVEAEGEVHIMSAINCEYTLCGDAFDLDSDEPGYEQIPTDKRTVTCDRCIRETENCRGVRVRKAKR